MPFSKINNIHLRIYKITTRSNLHIGGGEAYNNPTPIDNAVSKLLIFFAGEDKPRAIPWIPPTSFRGKCRSWVERYLKTDDNIKAKKGIHEDKLKELVTYYSKPEDIAQVTLYKDVCNFRENYDQCEELKNDEPSKAITKIKKDDLGLLRPCKVCKLFGYSGGQKSRIRFLGGYPSCAYIKAECPTIPISRNAIDRHTGTTIDGALFHQEVVPPGVDFYMFVLIENLETDEKELIKAFEDGLRIDGLGAGSGYGQGLIELECEHKRDINSTLWKNTDINSVIKSSTLNNKENFVYPDLPFSLFPDLFLLFALNKKPTEFNNHVTGWPENNTAEEV